MALKNTYQEYGFISKLFHLMITILIIGMLGIGFFLSDIDKIFVTNLHKVTGLITLVLAILMILWELFNQKPAYPVTLRRWEQIAAKSVQHTLLLLLILMPLSGWIFSTAGGKSPHVFGAYLPMPSIPQSHAIKSFFKESHKIMAWVILTLLSIHVLAALKHWLWDKDGIMQRVWKFN